MAGAVQEVLYLRSLLGEMGIKCEAPTVVEEDNQSCIKMCKNPVMQKRTKHIDIKFHFVRERVDDSAVQLRYCPTEGMCADLLMKSLCAPKVQKHQKQLLGISLDLVRKCSLSGGVETKDTNLMCRRQDNVGSKQRVARS